MFFNQPTNLEPPGTVFRIDAGGCRFIVDRLTVEVDEGPEASSRLEQRMEVKLGVLARFVGLVPIGANVGGGRVQTLEFEVHDPVRAVTTDVALRAPLDILLEQLERRPDDRYFVIRETRSASGIIYRLSEGQVAELGGEGPVHAALSAGASLSAKGAGVYEITQPFPERLRVTFMPEEIKRVSAGLAGEPRLGLVPVTTALEWCEPEP